MLENTEGEIKNGQSGNIGYTRRSQTKQRRKTICVGYHYIRKEAHITQSRHEPSYKLLEVKTNRT